MTTHSITKYMNIAIDNRSHKMLKNVLSKSSGNPIINGCSDDNTLLRAIRSVLSDKNLHGFS